MARTRLTQEARKAKTREALIDHAATLFARRGVESTSLDEVALAAGFTKGAIYASFPNKQALIDAVIERHVVYLDPAPLLRSDLPLGDRLALTGRLAGELIGAIPKETVILDLEFSLGMLRNPRRRSWAVTGREAEFAEVPGKFAALNAAQGATSPFTANELLFLMATLIRALARALNERPGAMSLAGVETLFGLLSGEGVSKAKRKVAKPRKRAG